MNFYQGGFEFCLIVVIDTLFEC